jgi:hypothetical protein
VESVCWWRSRFIVGCSTSSGERRTNTPGPFAWDAIRAHIDANVEMGSMRDTVPAICSRSSCMDRRSGATK